MTVKITDHSSPLVYGYDEISHVFRGNGPIFSVPDRDRRYSPLQFGTKHWDEDVAEENNGSSAPLVLSGGIVQGANIIDGQPAIVSKPLDDGHVVMLSWNPMHRHVNLQDHAFVYNAILHWNDL